MIIAREPSDGSPSAPRLLLRVSAPSFPLAYSLTTADTAGAAAPLPRLFVVEARLDADGNASTAGPDDLAGVAPELVADGAAQVDLVLGSAASEAGPTRAAGAPSQRR